MSRHPPEVDFYKERLSACSFQCITFRNNLVSLLSSITNIRSRSQMFQSFLCIMGYPVKTLHKLLKIITQVSGYQVTIIPQPVASSMHVLQPQESAFMCTAVCACKCVQLCTPVVSDGPMGLDHEYMHTIKAHRHIHPPTPRNVWWGWGGCRPRKVGAHDCFTCMLLAVTRLPLVKAFNFSYGSSTPYLQRPQAYHPSIVTML